MDTVGVRRWIKGGMERRIEGLGWTEGQTDGQCTGCIDGWLDGRRERREDGWTDRPVQFSTERLEGGGGGAGEGGHHEVAKRKPTGI